MWVQGAQGSLMFGYLAGGREPRVQTQLLGPYSSLMSRDHHHGDDPTDFP